ncbi:MAG TPA: NADPH:quinone oxidoreductase family protein [Clostridia bacterium]|nr:NADPH:quinone oxidoreductase family protein [Clostridia bacterium]
MKALVVTRIGGPEELPDMLEIREIPEPVANEGEVLVRVEAVGVNFADVLGVKGKYPGGPQPPYVPGREFSGVVEATGEAVMGYAQHSACAERIAVSRKMVWSRPQNWDATLGAAFPVNYFTAWLALWKGGVVPEIAPADPSPIGDAKPYRALIHAAAGGVGTAGVQLGRLMEIETFGTASQDTKLERLKEFGLDHGINYKREDYEQRVMELTNGEGVDVVFDSLAGEHTAKSLRCCRFLGRVIMYGNTSGERPKFDTMAMYSKAASLHGLWLSKLSLNETLMQQALRSMTPWIDSGRLKPIVGATLPFEQTADAYRMLLERTNFGKVALTLG